MQTTDTAESIALKEKIASDSSRIVAEIRAEIGELETQYLVARKEQKLGVVILVLTFLSAHLLAIINADVFLVLVWAVLFFFGLKYGFKYFFGKLRIIRQYNAKINKIIFRRVLILLGLNGSAVNEEGLATTDGELTLWQEFLRSIKKNDTPELVMALLDLESSELIQEPHNTNQVDNVFTINYKNSTVKVIELDTKHVTGSGKNQHTKYIFHGYFVIFDLKKELSGKTFITTEKEKSNDIDIDINFFAVKDGSEVRETVLEWNEFEDLLHVTTNNELEARYILTPNFMHDLYEWWKGKETNIRLSFIDNRLYILYPDNNIKLNQTIEHITDENISDYVYSIAWPLQNVIKLIDDVRL